ncbi:hypothetical protein YA62_000280 [Agrobacterium sp. LC34]|nr:hypothetical protein CFBP6623_00985 [Agrobacterium tumefaciens]TKT67294.1 hypothetical protein YA62_000280 [Agrobacterium sp. LC34]
MQEFPDMSIGEFHAVENERGLIIKFKTGAFPVKCVAVLRTGKCEANRLLKHVRRCRFHPACYGVQKS